MGRKSERFFGEVETIDINNIRLPTYRFRTVDDIDIQRMSNSIKLHGLLQPVVVRPKDGYFETVAGCTRFLACKSLHWRKIPCHIIQLNEVQTFEVALIENIERKSITPLDEAKAFKRYCFDNGWGSVSELSSKIGKSPSYITKRMALLELPSDVQSHIKNSELKPSTAEEISTIKDPEKQSQLAELIVKRHLTTMKARQLVKEDQDPYYCENSEILEVRSDLQPFNKAIVALRIAMSKIAAAIEEEDEAGDNNDITNDDHQNYNIFINELLMYHKRLLHDQIDNLMKAKKKYAKNIFRYRMMLK
ncbi:MAG: ParB/RepB/Spo0J family partition protein [Candidatus Nitrosocosmicus sp.]